MLADALALFTACSRGSSDKGLTATEWGQGNYISMRPSCTKFAG